MSFSQDGRDLLIATRGAEIFEVHIADGSLKGKVLVKGHGVRALWGLATHPTKEEFATCGDDATIRIWDAKSCASVKVSVCVDVNYLETVVTSTVIGIINMEIILICIY